MKVYIAFSIGCILGFFMCAILSSTKTAKFEARLPSSENIMRLAIKVIGYLGLWDDHEFDELRKEIDKHEEE